jgi:two-component system, LytTR family, sensor kinase
MKKNTYFFYYRIHYLVAIIAIFLGSILLTTKNQSTSIKNTLLCLAYAVVITANSFIADHLLLPKFLYKKKRLLFAASSILLLVVSAFILMPIIYLIHQSFFLISQNNNSIGSWIFSYFMPLFLALVITTIIQITKDQAKTDIQLQALQKEHIETELNFLKSQINPHFLFNSLNTVYFQIDKSNAAARTTLLQFTNMLQYQLYDCTKHTTPIEREIAYIENYIAIQKLRKEASYNIEMEVSDSVKGFSFAPLIFICFVENAFKYISHFENKPNFIKIKIDLQQEQLIFTCINSTMHVEVKEAMQYGGIGLQNVKRRLALLYPNKHHLDLDKQTDIYTVSLKVTIL